MDTLHGPLTTKMNRFVQHCVALIRISYKNQVHTYVNIIPESSLGARKAGI